MINKITSKLNKIKNDESGIYALEVVVASPVIIVHFLCVSVL